MAKLNTLMANCKKEFKKYEIAGDPEALQQAISFYTEYKSRKGKKKLKNIEDMIFKNRLLIEDHTGTQFLLETAKESVLEGLKELASNIGYKNNDEAGFVVLEINGVKMNKQSRGMNGDIAQWEYIGNEDKEFWGWNNERLLTAKK